MLFVAVLVGAFLMALMARMPFFGPIVAGLIAGLIARGPGRGLVAGLLSGAAAAILATLALTGAGTWLGGLMFGAPGAVAGGTVAMVLAGGILILGAYFGLLGLVGGFFGGLISRR
jgi:hypothetical protein